MRQADLKVALSTTTCLSLQQHLDIAPDILSSSTEDSEGELQPLMMAQAVPNPPSDKKRVKVYELRNNDWFDRGTGFCTATYYFVCCNSLRGSPYYLLADSYNAFARSPKLTQSRPRMNQSEQKNRVLLFSPKNIQIECSWRL